MAPREKPPTPREELEAILATVEMVSARFPGAVVDRSLPYGEAAQRCAGMVMTQIGRVPCANVADPKFGSMCQDPRGCRREGRVNGYAGA
jgi:hypothetical protein